ncbi:hypoxanthine phosphoribosyltransferase [Candidatus Hakubella thermalkaliphila]|uniref:Hypoxanthine phosphoribosyltransferase n=3 Tax=Candidatus Hakubella thermalkaliphila TaxID=2754717 RepID=A0A6V8Q471_9ACTN|nr:hypoxanthine phosphoribosyltransferase [Candidatus Hakubella thermalkaliphila]GFP30268.1 hypoxanthine phosphoribosyltransferase [Candidatus Hakubella thermalkaliphila]GFP36777.1 hypoxanthine phosphoribosyltransferase [Candidatus Hakubella thermalkaliphila]GFP38864.1 hypoxanthine phosphoribosyltransferase [Candidatus Hakubella thermalkaliphila]GFP42170.1 hypoxanthine phosphoribosyltransferase [Candidatus Hakubella thermalkaliphila]
MDTILGPMLISAEEIRQRVASLGEEITRDYQGKDLILVNVLRGGVVFLADLIREIKLPLAIDFMDISSYGISEGSSGVVRITKDLVDNIEGKDVLIVEDIIDTGLTLRYLLRNLKAREPATLEVCTLLDKSVRRIADIKIKYKGFDILDKYVVGYGLDFQQKYRNLPDIYVIKDEKFVDILDKI